MTWSLKAVFENGVLRPLEPVPFKEHELVDVTVRDHSSASEDLLDSEFIRYCETRLMTPSPLSRPWIIPASADGEPGAKGRAADAMVWSRNSGRTS
jgi:predicted DNA-binding antitoxin AbrB/MazE fold protein